MILHSSVAMSYQLDLVFGLWFHPILFEKVVSSCVAVMNIWDKKQDLQYSPINLPPLRS